MYTCLLCKYPTELDDVMAPTQRGTCICLRCYLVQIEDLRRLPRELQAELRAVLAAA